MSAESVLEKARQVIREIAPPSVDISEIELEGPVFVIYTRTLDEFAKDNEIVKRLAQTLKRRVSVRPHPDLLTEEESAKKVIEKLVPEEAEVTNIYFDHDTGEVTIEALYPGVAAGGKEMTVLNEIKTKTGWAPKVARSPPIPSKTLREIREYLRAVKEERKEFLRKTGRRINRDIIEGENWVRVTTLGGFRQVGRSCALLSTRNSKIMVDIGIDVSSSKAFPYLHAPELMPLESLDAVVITHAHLDHSGLLPALFKYGYDGPVYCTPPTRDLMTLLQLDYIKVGIGENNKAPYESTHVREVVKHCITLNYGETTDIAPDVKLTFHNAGHILGSSTAHFHIGEGMYNVAFSGDIKFEKTWLFNPAVNRFPRLEALILEATYGGHNDTQPSRAEASEQLKDILVRTLERKGKVMIPVFAVGRSQEVMMVIEDLVRTGVIPKIPVYLDGMIWEATALHTAYPEYLNSNLRTQMFQKGDNPFLSDTFQRVDSMETRESILVDPDPCIVLATSGMLNGGPIMTYFREWAGSEENTLIFVGYQAEGTLGRRIQKGEETITLIEKGRQIELEVKLNVETCDGFSGHSDRRQLMAYVGTMDPRPEKVLVGHGEENKCVDLASSLYRRYGLETRAPYNLETYRLK
ncbi:MAG: beta-CASP ribonuclease aCPSF1 [Thermoplasmata archaeon]|nr:beta-CASP ribonuclease aCPSF1 [Thermoplasmata archaeon]